ncbi:MAG: pitrilysin family protein [Thioalkalispiraceae bacterium]|jgi:zinc protease
MQRYLLLLLAGLAVLSTPNLVSAQSTVHEYKLENGLKLLVKEDHRAPIVVSQIWYKVGASSEHNGITGISHVLEHMMFKGTEKIKPGDFSKIIKEHGGRDNAFTGRDYTAYFQLLEKSRLEVSFEMEADRMRNLTLPEEEFLKEVEVVKEERRMRTEDKPRSLTYEQFNAAAYTNNPYQHPIIGWMNDLDNMKVGDLRDWYQKWYAPNNATIVVAGDVKPDEVYKLAKKHFAPLQREDVPELKPRKERQQLGPRKVTVRAPAKVPYMIMGYKVPVLRTVEHEWEPYALEVLAGVLSGSRSSRFPKILVRDKQIAVNADVGYNMHAKYNEMFLLDATPAQGHSVDVVIKAIQEQIGLIKQERISEEELNRVKAQVIASDVYEKDSVFYQAMILGTLETVGLRWQMADEYLEKIKAVTPEQVQQVAKKYFIENHLTVAVLEPQSMEQVIPRSTPSVSPRH